MQGLLCLIFVLLATALAFVLGKDLLGDGSLLETVFGLFKAPKVAIALTLSILVAAVIAAFAFAWQAHRRRRPIGYRLPGQVVGPKGAEFSGLRFEH